MFSPNWFKNIHFETLSFISKCWMVYTFYGNYLVIFHLLTKFIKILLYWHLWKKTTSLTKTKSLISALKNKQQLFRLEKQKLGIFAIENVQRFCLNASRWGIYLAWVALSTNAKITGSFESFIKPPGSFPLCMIFREELMKGEELDGGGGVWGMLLILGAEMNVEDSLVF